MVHMVVRPEYPEEVSAHLCEVVVPGAASEGEKTFAVVCRLVDRAAFVQKALHCLQVPFRDRLHQGPSRRAPYIRTHAI